MCDHPKVLAGHLRADDKHAIGYYCPTCNTVTYEARGKQPLRQSRSGDTEARERAIRQWLAS
ncbi:hypothetical protein [Deinococcus apachensis]|uniref:hypothetical protein n=1 Tax=Deinococcus apachensis TaxID=309886 RepID=UPI00037B7934|nr:hypothetical protein [Deinococcus apachensis]